MNSEEMKEYLKEVVELKDRLDSLVERGLKDSLLNITVNGFIKTEDGNFNGYILSDGFIENIKSDIHEKEVDENIESLEKYQEKIEKICLEFQKEGLICEGNSVSELKQELETAYLDGRHSKK